MQDIPHFHDQAVRDLAWSCFGPSLVTDFSGANNNHSTVKNFNLALSQERENWLQTLDNNPAPLYRHLATVKSTRLGLYFEALWQYFFTHDPDYLLIVNNLPVYTQTHTLGEFDLILFQQQTQTYCHLELAVKFFLNASQQATLPEGTTPLDYACWLGPNTNDRLDKKIHRFLQHQTQLSSCPEGTLTLKKHGLTSSDLEKLEKSIALKGCLFYPSKRLHTAIDKHQSTTTRSLLAADHRRGGWFTVSDFINTNTAADNKHWQVLHKSCWISPAFIPGHKINEALQNGQLMDAQQINHYLAAYFRQQKRPLLLTTMEEDKGGLLEQSRLFITPDHWPAGMSRADRSKS